MILSGDHVYEMDYRELLARHVETNADVTIATIEHPVKHATHFGVVEVDKDFRVTGFQEKPERPRPLPLRPDMAHGFSGVREMYLDKYAEAFAHAGFAAVVGETFRDAFPETFSRKRPPRRFAPPLLRKDGNHLEEPAFRLSKLRIAL